MEEQENILDRIKYLGEEDSVSTQYYNKPFFNDVKRVLRAIKRAPQDKTKPKKMGFFLREVNNVAGSKKNKEEIVRTIFGKSNEMSIDNFIKGLFSYAENEFPKGDIVILKKEEGFQTVQRMIPDVKRNKTISASIFGNILLKVINKFNDSSPEFNEKIYRSVHDLFTEGHFSSAAAFVRFTEMTDDWLHFDAFQTDVFNRIRRKLYKEGGNSSLASKFMKELESKEFEFYKTAVSYIVQTHPKVKVFTANTVDIVKRVEKISGELKLIQLYHKLPKELGFKLVPIEKIFQIFDTRPGKVAEEKKAALRKGLNIKKIIIKEEKIKEIIKDVNKELNNIIDTKKSHEISKLEIDSILEKSIKKSLKGLSEREVASSAFHQIIDEIEKKCNRSKEELNNYLRSPDTIEKVVKLSKQREESQSELWWANRGTIFEEIDVSRKSFLNILERVLKI